MTKILYHDHIKTTLNFNVLLHRIKSQSNMINMALITFSSIVNAK